MEINWAHKHQGIGSGFGYTHHEKNMLAQLERYGVQITDKAHIVLQLIPPYYYHPWRFHYNILFSMYEFEPLPEDWKTLIQYADLVIVPCEHNRRLFQDATSRPVEVCPEGIEPSRFPYSERFFKLPFVFLFIGDNNPRKGTYHIAKAWELFNQQHPELTDKIQLIMKMTAVDGVRELKQVTCNSYIDMRILPFDDDDAERTGLPTLRSLYKYANAFLLPSMGEGWALTLSEAMATGLPCVYTPWSGPNEFADETVAYPVEYDMQDVTLYRPDGTIAGVAQCANPNIEHIAERMWQIFNGYETALEKGRKASRRMHTKFTWNQAGDRFIEILEKHTGETVDNKPQNIKTA